MREWGLRLRTAPSPCEERLDEPENIDECLGELLIPSAASASELLYQLRHMVLDPVVVQFVVAGLGAAGKTTGGGVNC